jgi:Mn-dependent DtxR family transcriptional regulator
MELTDRQKNWLMAAAMASWRQGSVFNRVMVRDWLRLSVEIGDEVVRTMEKEGLVSLLPNDEAILTDKGRKVAETLTPPDQMVWERPR